jgi:preprotein translocase subunit SecG
VHGMETVAIVIVAVVALGIIIGVIIKKRRK